MRFHNYYNLFFKDCPKTPICPMSSGTGGAKEKMVTSLRSACPLFSFAELVESKFLVIEYNLYY